MAATLVVDTLPSGLGTLTLELYEPGETDLANPATIAVAEDATRKGRYEWTVSEALAGLHEAVVKNAGGSKIGGGAVLLADDAGPYYLGSAAALAELAAIRDKTDDIGTGGAILNNSGVSDTGEINIRRGDTIDFEITAAEAIADADELWLTWKRRADQDDSEAVLMLTLTQLALLNGAEPLAGQTGALTIVDAPNRKIRVQLSADATADLTPHHRAVYDIQKRTAGGVVRTVGEGAGKVTADVTRTTGGSA